MATLGITAISGIDEALDALSIPNLSDVIDLGPFSFATDALDAVVDLFESAIRGIVYVFLVIIFDQFFTAVKSQFVGSFTSIFFLVSSKHDNSNYNYSALSLIPGQASPTCTIIELMLRPWGTRLLNTTTRY